MKILITTGPTWEAIDAVRYIGNRSSGRMGIALAQAAASHGCGVTAIVGPGVGAMPPATRRIDIESASQMHEAVLREFSFHDVLIMAAAVADYRPKRVEPGKLPRQGAMSIELEATQDIVADAVNARRPDQKVIAFSLEIAGNIDRAEEKMRRKKVDLMIYNPLGTMNSDSVDAVLLWPDGQRQVLGCRTKNQFADELIERIGQMELPAAGLWRDRKDLPINLAEASLELRRRMERRDE